MRKLLFAMLLIVSVFALASCKQDTDPTLASPKNVAISNGVLTWSSVKDAEYYIVYIDTRPIEVHGTQLDLKNEYILVGTHLINVVAVKGDKQSLPSAVVQYTVLAVSDPEDIAVGVLAVLDPNYALGLTRADFASDWEYDDYLSALRMVNAYAAATSSINMTEENAVGLFNDFYQMASTGMPESLSDLMEAMEMFEDNQATPYAVATILYHMVLVSMEMQVENEIRWGYGDPEETQAIIDALELNAAISIQSLELMISFAMDFKDAMTTNVINLIDDASERALTIAEIVIIKNELVGILQDVMPSANDFAFLYSTLMTIGGALTGEDMSGFIVHADFLGALDHQTITIALEFIKSVDAQTIEDVMALVVDLYVYDPYYYYPSVDPVTAVELALYILTYIDDFKDDHAALFNDLEALLGSSSVEALFVLFIDQMILLLEDDPYADQMAIMLLQAFKNEYDNLVAAADVFMAIGENVVAEFINSQAALIFALMDIDETIADMTMEQTIDYMVDTILPMIINYNTAIFSELDQASILAILNVIKIPVTLTLSMSMMSVSSSMPDLPNIDPILNDVAFIIADLISLEMAILNAISSVDVSGILTNENLDDMGLAAVLVFISVLDETLTSQNENLVRGIVNRVFDNILKDPSMMDLHGMSNNDIDSMKTMALAQVDFFIGEIRAIADFNFNALTSDDMERIGVFAEILDMLFGSIGGGNYDDNPTEIFADESIYIYYEHNNVVVKFVPQQSGYYWIFTSVNGYSPDTRVYLYDASMNLLAYDDDSGSYYNFSLNYYFVANQTYYFAFNTWGSNEGFLVTLLRN